MVKVLVIVNPKTEKYVYFEELTKKISGLKEILAQSFKIGIKEVLITFISALKTENEKDVQIEIQYYVGVQHDVRKFDFSSVNKNELANKCLIFLKRDFTELTFSFQFKPQQDALYFSI